MKWWRKKSVIKKVCVGDKILKNMLDEKLFVMTKCFDENFCKEKYLGCKKVVDARILKKAKKSKKN